MGCTCSRVWIGDICAPRNGDIKEGSRLREISVFSPASSNGLNGEARDLLNQLSLTRDSEVGIARLSRVSSQYLPPEGSRTVKVPSGKYELQYSYLSQRGYYPDALDKANQDSFCIHTPFGTSPDDNFFGVFDGHGEFGAQCSQFVKRKLCENLLRNSKFNSNIVQACHASFLATNSQLHADTLDDSMSGTTAITIFVRGRTLYVANTGDSRAVIAERRGKDVKAVDLSIDQTPYRSDELERAKLCGARVLTLDQIEGLKDPDVVCWGTEEGDDGDPPRLWVENGMYPGTAFTRSIGDSIAETIGVVANPEIVVFELTPDHPFFVIASDGVFEFLSSQAVVDMVLKHKDPRDACAAIVAESYRLWLQYETRTDDITVIVIHVNGLTDDASVQSKTAGGIVRAPSAPQVVEVTGSESPSTTSWMSRTQHVRHDLSRARIRAIESSLENGAIWVPPSPAHRKTWEEEAHIERALHDHFLFRKLTVSQCHVLLDCMHRVEVQAGEVVVKQGGEGDCFYVVGSGEYEVLATQEGTDGEVTRVLQRYTAEKLTSFGELALMYNKPLQASVRAVTDGTLWALKREDFRGVLMSEFANLSSLKLLRSVDLLSRLTILQLSQIADSLSEISFSSGQIIADKDEVLAGLYIIQKGQVRITVDAEALNKPNINSLLSDLRMEDGIQGYKELCVEKNEGSYFGEWTLLGEHVGMLTIIAVDDVECTVLMKEKFDSIVGSLPKLSQDDHKSKSYSPHLSERFLKPIDSSELGKVKVNLSDVDWKKCVYTTDCCEIGLVSLCDTGKYLTLKRYSKHKIRSLGKEAQVLKEKNMMKSLNSSAGVPQVVCTCADAAYIGILLNARILCPIASILYKPLNESSAQFCAACVVTALEDLHKIGVLFRGVSPDVLTFDETGYVQLVDFRFANNLLGERTFTTCGMVDSLSPEIVQGKGHGLSSDWWALGVLIYFMLVGEMPFGSWRESELETFSKIAKGQITLPETLSHEAVDIITKLLEVDENTRLGRGQGHEATIKGHPWFKGVEWNEIRDGSMRVPHEILSRLMQQLETRSEDCHGSAQIAPPFPRSSSNEGLDDDNASEWLEDW